MIEFGHAGAGGWEQYAGTGRASVRVPYARIGMSKAVLICTSQIYARGTGSSTHACEAEVTQSSDSSTWVVQEIGRLDISMDDTPCVDIPERAKHTAEISLDPCHRQRTKIALAEDDICFASMPVRSRDTHPKVFIAVVWHNCHYLVMVTKCGDKL